MNTKIKLDAARMPGYTEAQRLGYVYHTAINKVSVTVRLIDGGYHITVEREGKVVNTLCNDSSVTACAMADILLQIYDAGLEMELLAH